MNAFFSKGLRIIIELSENEMKRTITLDHLSPKPSTTKQQKKQSRNQKVSQHHVIDPHSSQTNILLYAPSKL